MKALIAAVLVLASLPSFGAEVEEEVEEVDHGSFVLTHDLWDGNKLCVQWSSHYYNKQGQCSYFSAKAQRKKPSKTHEVELEFSTPDYFIKDNQGHWGVGLGPSDFPDGDVTRIVAQGRGVIIGNLTGYPRKAPGCGPTSVNNVLTPETWWHDGKEQKNCVMGWHQKVRLKNDVFYRLTVRSTKDDSGTYIAYVLEKKIENIGWEVLQEFATFDFTPAAEGSDEGIFIAAVFTKHRWTLRITRLRERWY